MTINHIQVAVHRTPLVASLAGAVAAFAAAVVPNTVAFGMVLHQIPGPRNLIRSQLQHHGIVGLTGGFVALVPSLSLIMCQSKC